MSEVRLVPLPSELDETYPSSLIWFYFPHDMEILHMETWNYPPTKPEVHNRIAIKEGPNQVLDKQVDKQTDRQTDTLITILRTPTRGEMIRYTPSVAWSYAPITDESRTAADGRLFVVLTTRHVADVLVLDTKCRTLYLDITMLSLIHIWRCRRSTLCRSRWSPYH